MRGEVATIPDIELEELVLPSNLVSDESLSPDDEIIEERSETHCHYRIDTICHSCERPVRCCVSASNTGIRLLQQLLLEELSLLCPGCSRHFRGNGRL
nr:MAG: E7 [Gammapapillomavirus sp.]